jgi:hypothetical protein
MWRIYSNPDPHGSIKVSTELGLLWVWPVFRRCSLLLGTCPHLQYFWGSVLVHFFIWVVIPTWISGPITFWYLGNFILLKVTVNLIQTSQVGKGRGKSEKIESICKLILSKNDDSISCPLNVTLCALPRCKRYYRTFKSQPSFPITCMSVFFLTTTFQNRFLHYITLSLLSEFFQRAYCGDSFQV